MKTILAIDFDANAAATYKANFSDTQVECGPVVDFIASIPYADVVIGGPPCQPHSVAGKRKASADARDGGPDFINAVCKSKPRHFLMENVPGLLSSEDGKYWHKLYACMEDAGYIIQYRVLDAVNYGVPQFRSRLWVWGIRKDVYSSGVRHCWPAPTHAWPWPEPSIFGETLLPAVTVGIALNIPHRQVDGTWFEGVGTECKIHLQGHGGFDGGEFHQGTPSPTLRNCLTGCGDMLVMGGGRNDIDRGDGHFDRNERDITAEPCTTIAGTHLGTHKGAQNPRIVTRILDCQNETEHGVDEPIGTIQGNAEAKGGQAGHKVIEYRWSDAMRSKHPPASPASPASPAMAKWYKGGAEGLVEVTVDPKHPFQQQQQQPANTITSGLVRRLVPLECARLQSMPDDFRWPEKISKTAMYKIIGNGQSSLQVWNLRQAIQKSDPGIETVIDLFCGGGVGAVGFHGRFWSYIPDMECAGAAVQGF